MMEDEFRKEWRERELSADVLLRARNRAWTRLSVASAVGFQVRAWQLAAAGLGAIALLLLWLGPAGGPDRRVVQPEVTTRQALPAQSPARTPAVAPLPKETAREAPRAVAKKHERVVVTPQRRRQEPPVHVAAVAARNEPRRVELNFTLAETGVRMIWILDSEFEDGGTR